MLIPIDRSDIRLIRPTDHLVRKFKGRAEYSLKLESYILATNKFFLNNSIFSQLYEIKLYEMIEQLDPQLLVTVSGRYPCC